MRYRTAPFTASNTASWPPPPIDASSQNGPPIPFQRPLVRFPQEAESGFLDLASSAKRLEL
jgi:hypothetical protein